MGRLLTILLLAMGVCSVRAATYNWTNVPNTTAYAPGDTVKLWGTYSTQFVPTNSGTLDNPITFQQQPGSKFSAARWSTGGPTVAGGAVEGTGLSFLVFDGFYIEATNSGTALSFDDYSVGILLYSANNVAVINSTVTNMYRRTPNSADNKAVGGGIQLRTSSRNNSISNCVVAQMNAGFYVGYGAGDSNFSVLNCTAIAQGEAGVLMGANNDSSTFTNVIIAGNYFNDCTTWAGQPNIHCNHIHVHCVAGGASQLTGVRIYGNHFDGDMGSQQTSFCFVEGNTIGSKVYNNLFTLTTDGGGNGLVFFNGAPGWLAANNTFVTANTNYTAIGTSDNGSTGGTATNNLFFNVAIPIGDPVNSLLGSDYNVAFSGNPSYPQWWRKGGNPEPVFYTFPQWKTAYSYDLNSKTNFPSLGANYVPTEGDTVARGAGVNLTALGITTDYFGNARPSSGPWTIGYAEQQASQIWNVTTLNVGTINVGQ